MNGFRFDFCGEDLVALQSGALWWQREGLLCVSDLHLGRAERHARLGRGQLPPYETQDTLSRLETDLAGVQARKVICLGDSFDDLGAARSLSEANRLWIARLQAGRDWMWIEGNHDPGPVNLGGAHLAEYRGHGLTFRHIATPDETGEVSGHYHPKARVRTRARWITRPAFLIDSGRIVMPAYGTYTGGLYCHDASLSALMAEDAVAVLTGPKAISIPMPR